MLFKVKDGLRDIAPPGQSRHMKRDSRGYHIEHPDIMTFLYCQAKFCASTNPPNLAKYHTAKASLSFMDQVLGVVILC